MSEDIVRAHKGCRVLILNLTRPLRSRIPKHLSTEDAAQLADRIGPELTILTHFGMKLIHEGVKKQARYIEERSGVRTVGAFDLMCVEMEETIRIHRRGGRQGRKGINPDAWIP